MHNTKLNPGKKGKAKDKKALSKEWWRIEEFFLILGEEGPAEELWKMLKLALVVDNDYTDELERSNMIFLYENTKMLFEDVFVLLEEQKKKIMSK